MKKTLVVLLAVLAVNASLFAEDANFRGARLADAEEALRCSRPFESGRDQLHRSGTDRPRRLRASNRIIHYA